MRRTGATLHARHCDRQRECLCAVFSWALLNFSVLRRAAGKQIRTFKKCPEGVGVRLGTWKANRIRSQSFMQARSLDVQSTAGMRLSTDGMVMGAACSMRRNRAFVACFRDGLVDNFKELIGLHDLNIGRASGLIGYDPDSGGMFDADALTECIIGFDFRGKFPQRIYDKRKSNAVLLGKFISKGA